MIADTTIREVRTILLRMPWPDDPWLAHHPLGPVRELVVVEVVTRSGITGMGYLHPIQVPALRTIAALTEILPDDTWLTELTLRQRKLTMAGRSAGAARLIGLLSADPTIRDAAFVAPVTRADSGGVDVFSIRAEVGM